MSASKKKSNSNETSSKQLSPNSDVKESGSTGDQLELDDTGAPSLYDFCVITEDSGDEAEDSFEHNNKLTETKSEIIVKTVSESRTGGEPDENKSSKQGDKKEVAESTQAQQILNNLPKLSEIEAIDSLGIRTLRRENNVPKNKIIAYFQKVYKKWIDDYKVVDDASPMKIVYVYFLGIRNFELDLTKLTPFEGMKALEMGRAKIEHEIDGLEYMFLRFPDLHKEIPREKGNTLSYAQLFNKVREVVYYTEKAIRSAVRAKIAQDPVYDSMLNDDVGLSKFVVPKMDDQLTASQQLQLYILSQLSEKGYRRYRDKCYKAIFTPNGDFTHAWEEVCTLEEFVYANCQRNIQNDQWRNMTTGNSVKDVCNHLERVIDPQFKEIEKDRHVFAFLNGVYRTKEVDTVRGGYTDRFYKYSEHLDPSIVACKYFPLEFKIQPVEDWYDIPTPMFQSILDYQYKDEPDYIEICRWMYILLGRLLFDVGELDSWQVLPFIKGIAGSGKGRIIEIVRQFYEDCDIGTLGDEGEKIFGASAIYDKYMFVGPEIGTKFSMPQSQFQSIISGEATSISEKYKTPKSAIVKAHGILAGNEPPKYQNNSGSLARRIIVFAFKRLVKKSISDPDLPRKLKYEVADLLKKCVQGYLYGVRQYGNADIWKNLPKFFQETKANLSEQVNALQGFLGSGKVVFGEDLICMMKDFKLAYQQHCRENNLTARSLDADYYESPFQELSDKLGYRVQFVKDAKKRETDGKRRTGQAIIGLDIRDEEAEEPEKSTDK